MSEILFLSDPYFLSIYVSSLRRECYFCCYFFFFIYYKLSNFDLANLAFNFFYAGLAAPFRFFFGFYKLYSYPLLTDRDLFVFFGLFASFSALLSCLASSSKTMTAICFSSEFLSIFTSFSSSFFLDFFFFLRSPSLVFLLVIFFGFSLSYF